MTEYKASFELTGKTPLLMHFDNIIGSDQLKEWRQAPENKNQSVPGDDRSPAWTWHTYLYTDGEHVTMPSDNIMAALMAGGTQVILKKQKTYKELSQSGILIGSEHCKLQVDAGGRQLSFADISSLKDEPFMEQAKRVQELGFSLFVKRAKIGQAKHVRVRPRFNYWKVVGELSVLSKDLPFDVLEMIFSFAGSAGLGDWRPNSPKRPGAFGQFDAKLKKLR